MAEPARQPTGLAGRMFFEHPLFFGVTNHNHYGGDDDAPPLSPRVRAVLEQRNELDIELYGRILARFDAPVARWLTPQGDMEA